MVKFNSRNRHHTRKHFSQFNGSDGNSSDSVTKGAASSNCHCCFNRSQIIPVVYRTVCSREIHRLQILVHQRNTSHIFAADQGQNYSDQDMTSKRQLTAQTTTLALLKIDYWSLHAQGIVNGDFDLVRNIVSGLSTAKAVLR